MKPEDFKAGFEKYTRWSDAEKLVGMLDEVEQLTLLHALQTVNAYVGLDMRSEFYMGLLEAKTRRLGNDQ